MDDPTPAARPRRKPRAVRARRKPRAVRARTTATALSVASMLSLGGVLAWRDQPSTTGAPPAVAVSGSSVSSGSPASATSGATEESSSAAQSVTSTGGS